MTLPHLIQSRPMSRTICLKDRPRGICVSFDVEAALLTHPPFGVRIVQFRQSLLNTSPGVSWCGIYSTFCFYGRCIQAKEYRNHRRSPTNSSPLRKPDPSSRPRVLKRKSLLLFIITLQPPLPLIIADRRTYPRNIPQPVPRQPPY